MRTGMETRRSASQKFRRDVRVGLGRVWDEWRVLHAYRVRTEGVEVVGIVGTSRKRRVKT
jgi:hypothetical protein